MASSFPKTLYHYCSVDTFFNIIKNKSVWLSDVSKSNDSRELSWATDRCDFYILKSWTEYLENIKNLEMWNQVGTKDFKAIEELRESVSLFKFSKSWVFCLSSEKDDLGQWRGYADDGRGVSIGFNAKLLHNISLILFEHSKNGQCLLQKIKYSSKEERKFFEETAGLAQITVDKTPQEVIEIIRRACAHLSIFMPFFKHPKFSSEKEWRMAYTMDMLDCQNGIIPDISNLENYIEGLDFGNYDVVPSNGDLVSHLELAFPTLKNVITEIIIGPKSKLTPWDVKMFLVSVGAIDKTDDKRIAVRSSVASYR